LDNTNLMTKRHVVIATRKSPLALQQAALIKTLLQATYPDLSVELLGMTTAGDRARETPLAAEGGKGLFVKELETALLEGRADLAVHSMKDLPMLLPPTLCVPAMSERTEPRDVWVSNHYATMAHLPVGAVLGTSSLRRQTQLQALRSDVTWRAIRGNIHTRLQRLDEGRFDGIILAAAGLQRMGLSARIGHYFTTEQLLPAAGQGALGVECRADDVALLALLTPLNHAITYHCVSAERALCRHLGGGCTVPIAAYAKSHHGMLSVEGVVAHHSGALLRTKQEGRIEQAEQLGIQAAEVLLQQGAANMLKDFR
jgi:hydroxymethylbilane synthase